MVEGLFTSLSLSLRSLGMWKGLKQEREREFLEVIKTVDIILDMKYK